MMNKIKAAVVQFLRHHPFLFDNVRLAYGKVAKVEDRYPLYKPLKDAMRNLPPFPKLTDNDYSIHSYGPDVLAMKISPPR